MIYEIRGLSISVNSEAKTLGILTLDKTSGLFIHSVYVLSRATNSSAIINFLMNRFNCTINDISIAKHVSFAKVGISS